jgi:hypothetical protein
MAQFKVGLHLSIPAEGFVVIEAKNPLAAVTLVTKFINDGELTDSLDLGCVQFDRQSNLEATGEAEQLKPDHFFGEPINQGAKFVSDGDGD